MIKKEEAIKRCREVHGDKYDYSKVNFKKVTDIVTIICPIHGEFKQSLRQHYRGQGCPKCGLIKRAITRHDDTQSFIEKSKKIYGDTYEYEKTEYVDSKTPVTITCKEHGDFYVIPNSHLSSNRGCPACGKEKMRNYKRKPQEKFIDELKSIHGDKYGYDNIIYNNSKTKVDILCYKHGIFSSQPDSLLAGSGCPYCAREKQAVDQTMTLPEFIFKARAVYGDKYDYSKVNYVNGKTPVTIICPVHGEFEQKPYYHLAGNGCPKCGIRESKAEKEIYDFCCGLLGKDNVIQNSRKEIYPYEIDIYIPSLKTGIEYNGILWHSDKYTKDHNYHLKKLEKCQKAGIKLIQVFEDEFENNKDIVLSKIKHLINKDNNGEKIYARKCQIKKIDRNSASEFLCNNHIQGFSNSTVYLGAYYLNDLIGVMTFKKDSIPGKWELTRFATLNGTRCSGVAGKLFTYFIRKYNPEEVKSFADRRWTINENSNVYVKLGFEHCGYVKPDYRYFKHSDGIIRQHKFNFRKQILHRKYGLPLTMTETEMTKKLGYSKIYDCGLIKYIWTKE